MDIQNGNGVFTVKNGSRYEGGFLSGKRHGYGVFEAGGNKYAGDWAEGEMEGKGAYTWRNGNTYDGEWKNSKRDGKGVLILLEEEEKYEGEWKEGLKHG